MGQNIDHWLVNSCNQTTAVGFNQKQNDTITKKGKNNYNPIGIHILGDNCIGLGLFVEHQTCYPIIWDGNDGTLVFTQGECAYYNMNNNCNISNIGYKSGIYMTLGKMVDNFYYNWRWNICYI